MKRWIKGMRDAFFDSLFEIAKTNKDIVIVTSDTGAICHDEFKTLLPDQYVNVGIAEQNMIGIAAGLAMTGKIVYSYAIVPFATARCFEQIRVDLCCMDLPVNIVGIGCGFDYSTLGPTHHGTEDITLMRVLPGMTIFSPSDSGIAHSMAEYTAKLPGPKYIRLDRTGIPLIYEKEDVNLEEGLYELQYGDDLLIISTGRMVLTAKKVASRMIENNISAGIIDIFRIHPLNKELLIEKLKKYKKIAVLEEHFITGGLGSAILEFLNNNELDARILRIGIENKFCRVYGKREYLQCENNLDAESIFKRLSEWYRK